MDRSALIVATSVGLIAQLAMIVTGHYVPFVKVIMDPVGLGLRAKQVDRGKVPGAEIYEMPRPDAPRLLAYRDSMMIPLVPSLSENFSRSVYLSARQLDPATIDRERPDVVIDETVERGLGSLAAAPMLAR